MGKYFNIRNDPRLLMPSNTIISSSLLARLDRKIDDGVPEIGSVIAAGGLCITVAGIYDEAANPALCSAYIWLGH